MSTDATAGPGLADDDFAQRLAAQLDAYAGRPGPSPAADSPALVRELRAEHAWAGPPHGLREGILSRVRAEAAERSAAPAVEPEPAVPEEVPRSAAAPRRGPGPVTALRARWGRLTWAVPAAVLAAAVFAAGVVAVDRALLPDPAPPRGETFAAGGTSLAPGATATVRVLSTGSGFSVVADFTGLPPAAPGSYYAAWLRGPTGTVPLGSFHERRPWRDVDMWSGVDPKGYPTFFVTLQAEGDPPGPSTMVMMTATLPS